MLSLSSPVMVMMAIVTRITLARIDLPDVIIGNPNDMGNDILGLPISAKEFEESTKLKLAATPTGLEDPITRSGFFQGDIMVESEDQLYQILEGDTDGQNSAIGNPQKLWPNAIIPYVISANFSDYDRMVIALAMSEYHHKTCIRFVPRTTHRDYIHILRGVNESCSSDIGRSGGSQVVSLGKGCVTFGVVLHELMHAAGFWHEQSRPDRDAFVAINWSNIHPHLKYNFEKKTNGLAQDLGLGYDYSSIMHYGPYAFAINKNYPTIIPRKSGVTIGQRNGFSQRDIQRLNLLYKCSDGTPSPTTCVDKSVNCLSWAFAGFCSTHATFMSAKCKKSCKLCRSCYNQHQLCAFWARIGECKRSPASMRRMCSRACGFC